MCILFPGAILVAQWFQTTEKVTENQICKTLDNLAEQVKLEIKEKHPNLQFCDKLEGKLYSYCLTDYQIKC